MRWWAIGLMVCAVIAGCDRARERTPKFSDEQMREIKAAGPGMTKECLEKIRWGGIEAVPTATDQCFKMSETRRWRGLWRNAFEGSRFCPAPARECSQETPGDNIWLGFANGASRERLPDPVGGLYALEFDGRLTVHKGGYGHGGLSDREVVVDQLIALREVPEGDQAKK
jgi:hypothetical protein